MTRKDFELIAATLYIVKPASVAYTDTHNQWKRTVREFAQALSTTNHAFNRARFLKAAGLGD